MRPSFISKESCIKLPLSHSDKLPIFSHKSRSLNDTLCTCRQNLLDVSWQNMRYKYRNMFGIEHKMFKNTFEKMSYIKTFVSDLYNVKICNFTHLCPVSH